jgi:hypothetical protein
LQIKNHFFGHLNSHFLSFLSKFSQCDPTGPKEQSMLIVAHPYSTYSYIEKTALQVLPALISAIQLLYCSKAFAAARRSRMMTLLPHKI